MAHEEASGFFGGFPGVGTVAVEPCSRTVSVSPGVSPFTRKYHQQGQPRKGSPPGMKLIWRAALSISTALTDAPSKSDATVKGSTATATQANPMTTVTTDMIL